jgi:multidrug efflux system membrane fusion protein
MNTRTALSAISLAALLVGLVAGCRKPASPPPPTKQVIPVSHPVQREVTESVEYTGRTDAIVSVGVRARVTGYLLEVPFKEGAEIKKGDPLFEIDPRPYQALVDQAQAQVGVAEAQLKLGKANYERAKVGFTKNAFSQQELDQAKANEDQAAAQLEAAKATLDATKLNLSFTHGVSTLDGQVSRRFYTPGNLINQDQTLITTVVSVDPIYAYFDMDARTLLRIRNAINAGTIKPRDINTQTSLLAGLAPAWAIVATQPDIPVLLALEGEEGYPHVGMLDFVNNVVNPSTSTISVRGIFPNPKPENGRRLIVPGMFVRIRLPLGQPRQSLLVVDRAIGSDQGLKYVYVVTPQHTIEYRRVKSGPLQDDGLRVIEPFDAAAGTGLKPDDWVVIGGLQQVRPKMEVDPEESPMPIPGAPSAAPAKPSGQQSATAGPKT